MGIYKRLKITTFLVNNSWIYPSQFAGYVYKFKYAGSQPERMNCKKGGVRTKVGLQNTSAAKLVRISSGGDVNIGLKVNVVILLAIFFPSSSTTSSSDMYSSRRINSCARYYNERHCYSEATYGLQEHYRVQGY